LKSGDISWYSQFGFTPVSIEFSENGNNYDYEKYYQMQKNKIIIMTRMDSIVLMSKHCNEYPLLKIFIKHILHSNKDTMCECMKDFNFENILKCRRVNFADVLKKVFDLEIYEVCWVKEIYL